ncbi:hypothetical protein CcaverHIS641_0500080 [Cutaneotrichosporon cavernicola]|nr:hypothetical protein CcaverHIS641_0500080 [Cutaneotrichosporon cavernicola]
MMKAVVLKGPFDVKVEDRPTPTVQEDTDVIIKVTMAGLCGSDLHWYRGHQPKPYDFIVGHETIGRIVEVGSGVTKWKVGDMVIAPFSTSCGDCFFCNKLYPARCVQVQNFGNPAVPGGQAEYFRMPLAETSLFEAPADLPQELLILMTDILPTGYSTAMNARRLLDEARPDDKTVPLRKEGVCVVIGCGPVGLCAITSACTLFETVFATDLTLSRLELATKHGAIALPADQLEAAVLEATEGRGADAVLEVVGHESALLQAMKLARYYGVVSSCGVHTHDFSIPGAQLYGKNLRLQFGRCSVKTFFPYALQVLQDNRELFKTFVEHRISFDETEEFYKLFEQNKVAKTVFVVD